MMLARKTMELCGALAIMLVGCSCIKATPGPHPPFAPPKTTGALKLTCPTDEYSIGGNLTVDLKGDPDNRKDTWGRAGYVVQKIEFHPPAGCRTRILRVYGDFLIWPKTPKDSASAGALWGLQTTAPEGSVRVTPAADNTFLYVQLATTGEPARAAVDYDTSRGGLLAADNTLLSKMAVFLNTFDDVIHMEPSFVIVYRFEAAPKETK